MKTVTLEVCALEDVKRRFVRAFEGKAQGACISFETPALLLRVLSGKRWELLATMTGAGPMTIREAARRAGRDVKAVHGDVWTRGRERKAWARPTRARWRRIDTEWQNAVGANQLFGRLH